MIPLQSQEMFETLFNTNSPLTSPALVYFTAPWCGACKRIKWEFLMEEFPNLTIYKCDIDENKYTPGYCQVRSIPSFAMIHPGRKLTGPIQSSETAKVAAWIHTTLLANYKVQSKKE